MSPAQALLVALASCLAVHVGVLQADFQASDPGVRVDPPDGRRSAGGMLDGLTAGQKALFTPGLEAFTESDTIASGLGPRMNLDSCGGCHQAPTADRALR
jgi:mono/diheme cytochrome c family protein